MPDIRLVRPRGSWLWIVTAVLAFLAIAVWAFGTFGRDPTAVEERPMIGELLNFGAERTPVLPVFPTPFDSIAPLSARDLGILVQLRGTAESPVRNNAVFVRGTDNRRIMVRFEPPPPEGALDHIRAGGPINVVGYLQKIAVAEFRVWMDTLGVRVPRAPPAGRFGHLPDPAFARIDSLYIKEYYVSVRPEGVHGPPIEAQDE
jgi:hypothetical protein